MAASKRPVGRPRNPPGVPTENPKLQVRLRLELHAWATAQGPDAIRALLEAAMAGSEKTGLPLAELQADFFRPY